MATSENLQTMHGLVVAVPTKAFCDDIFYYIAKNFLQDPKDIFALASTSWDLWNSLQNEIYRTDILQAKFTHPKQKNDQTYLDRYRNQVLEQEQSKLYEYYAYVSTLRGFSSRCPYGFSSLLPGCRPPPPQGQTILQWAAATGVLPTVEKAIEVANYTWRDYIDLENPFHLNGAAHLATIFGHLDVLRAFANNGCSVNLEQPYAPTVFGFLRNTMGRGDIVESLTIYPSEPCVINTLGLALLRGHEDCAKLLVEYHDEQAVHSSHKMIHPLICAASSGMVDIAKILVQKGADVNQTCLWDNSTPLMWAAHRVGNQVMVDTLVKLGANLELRDERDRTALFWAARRVGNQDMINVLLKLGANLQSRDEYDRSVLSWAAEAGAHQNAYTLVKMGISFESDSRPWRGLAQCMLDDCFWECTQLMLANPSPLLKRRLSYCLRRAMVQPMANNFRTIRYFIENGIGLEQPKDADWRVITTVLHSAVYRLPFDLLELLLEKRNCDVNVKDNGGFTPACLLICRRGWDKSKAALLFKHGADPSACGTWKQRLVMQAIKGGGTEQTVQELLDKYDGQWPGLRVDHYLNWEDT
ncbi:ankyrin repeat-containing domain protein [Xylaria scruposa]|nr:ankyrin repeat-containing domain protein [Xylaria scruposa]